MLNSGLGCSFSLSPQNMLNFGFGCSSSFRNALKLGSLLLSIFYYGQMNKMRWMYYLQASITQVWKIFIRNWTVYPEAFPDWTTTSAWQKHNNLCHVENMRNNLWYQSLFDVIFHIIRKIFFLKVKYIIKHHIYCTHVSKTEVWRFWFLNKM